MVSNNVDKIVKDFRLFLNENLVFISSRLNDDLYHDWLQANWEILVESLICISGSEYLEIYGEGADCNELSSRVWRPQSLPTHFIRVSLIKDTIDVFTDQILKMEDFNNIEIMLDQYFSWDGKQYSEKPPFD